MIEFNTKCDNTDNIRKLYILTEISVLRRKNNTHKLRNNMTIENNTIFRINKHNYNITVWQ